MNFNKAEAGFFRSNPEAHNLNVLRLGSTDGEDVIGAPAEDTGSVDTTDKVLATGIRYTGKDGVSAFYEFFRIDQPTANRHPITVAIDATDEGALRLQDAVHNVIRSHEVGAITAVTLNGTAFDITHVGAGTLEAIVVDGADEGGMSRGAIATQVGIASATGNKPLKAKKAPKAKKAK